MRSLPAPHHALRLIRAGPSGQPMINSVRIDEVVALTGSPLLA
jgi:hypothetical protein